MRRQLTRKDNAEPLLALKDQPPDSAAGPADVMVRRTAEIISETRPNQGIAKALPV